MVLCGNFIGFKCSFHPSCRRRLHDETFKGRQLEHNQNWWGTNGCSAYYDGYAKNTMFFSKVADVSVTVGALSFITNNWEIFHCGCISFVTTSFTFAKSGAMYPQPSFLSHNDTNKTFTIAQQTDKSNVGTYTVTITAKQNATLSGFFEEVKDDFTITIVDGCLNT
jgi:hypothetical protein